MSTREWAEEYHGYIRMPVPERKAAVAELAAEGHTQREIAEVLGVDAATVNRDLKPSVADATPEPDPEDSPAPFQEETPASVADATPVIADRLGIAPGDPVMRTSYRFLADEEPVMLSTSFEPLAITEGTPIEQPESGPVTGVIPRFDQIGLHITHVKEDVTGRSARPYEAETLRVPQGVPVLVIERTYYVEDHPIETADIVVSSAKYLLSYRLEIPPRT